MATPSQDLLVYVQSSLSSGKTPDAIRAELKTAGWADADVDAAFGVLSPAPLPVLSPTNHQSRKWLIIAVCFVVVVALVVLIFFIFRKKQPVVTQSIQNSNANVLVTPKNEEVAEDKPSAEKVVIDDFGLILPVVNLSPSANCYLEDGVLNKVVLTSKILPSADSTTWNKQLSGEDKWNQELVDDLLTQNIWPIGLFKDAMKKPRFQMPDFSDVSTVSPEKVQAIKYGSYRNLAKVVALDAISRARKGDVSNGVAEALAIAVYGQRMAVSQIDQIGYVNGLGIKQTGLDALKTIIGLGKLSSGDIKNADSVLYSLEDTGPSLANVFKVSYWIKRNDLNNVFNNPADYYEDELAKKLRDPYFFELPQTINLMGELFRKSIEKTKESCHEFVDESIDQSVIDEVKKMEGENAFGRFYTYQIGYHDAMILNERCTDLALVATVRAALSAAAASAK